MRNVLLLVTILFFFASCEDSAYYQKSFGFKNNWQAKLIISSEPLILAENLNG